MFTLEFPDGSVVECTRLTERPGVAVASSDVVTWRSAGQPAATDERQPRKGTEQ